MKKLLTISLFILLSNMLAGQQYISINIDIDGYADIGHSIHQTEAGFLLTATSFCNNNISECFSIIQTNLTGEVTNLEQYQNFPLWITAGAAYGNVGVAISNDDDYFTGTIQSDSLQHDIFLMKTDELGDTIWMKTFGTSLDEANRAVIFSSDTSLLLLNASILAQGKYLVWLLNVDLHGNVIWEDFLGEEYKDAGYQDIIKLGNGDILVSYLTSEYNVPSNPYSMTVTKLDGQGNEKWTSRFASFDGYLYGASSCILALDNGGYLVNFMRDTFGFNDIPPIFVWLDSLGNVTQQYNFTNSMELTITDLIKSTDGQIIGVGQVDLLDYDMGFGGWVFAFTQTGEKLWERYIVDQNFLPEKLSWFSGVEEMDDGRLAIIGSIDTPPDFDAWLVVLDSMGCLEPGCTGEFQGLFSDTKPKEQSSKIMLYPNPVRGDAIFLQGLEQFPHFDPALITIYDSIGMVIRRQKISSRVDVEGLIRGIYFLSIQERNGQSMSIGKFVRN